MIHKKDLKEYEFETLEQYFDYIVESKINGQPDQVAELFKRLSDDQKKECLSHFADILIQPDALGRDYKRFVYYALKLCIENI